MSRYYSMSVTITGADPNRFDPIMAAASAEWEFDDWYSQKGVLTASGDAQLFGGETDQQFAERLTKAIWSTGDFPGDNGGKLPYLTHNDALTTSTNAPTTDELESGYRPAIRVSGIHPSETRASDAFHAGSCAPTALCYSRPPEDGTRSWQMTSENERAGT